MTSIRNHLPISKDAEDFMKKNYAKWRGLARHYCAHNKLHGEENDLLHDVLVSLLTTNRAIINELFAKKHNDTNQLDLYVMKMIKLNAYSPNAPYQQKLKRLKEDKFNSQKASTSKQTENEQFNTYDALKKIQKLLPSIEVNIYLIKVFEWRLSGESFKDWKGKESLTSLYRMYKIVENKLKLALKKQKLKA